jgi:hypothetical protein
VNEEPIARWAAEPEMMMMMMMMIIIIIIIIITCSEHYLLILRKRYTHGTWYIAWVLCQLAAT